jgi:hypothetical protein
MTKLLVVLRIIWRAIGLAGLAWALPSCDQASRPLHRATAQEAPANLSNQTPVPVGPAELLQVFLQSDSYHHLNPQLGTPQPQDAYVLTDGHSAVMLLVVPLAVPAGSADPQTRRSLLAWYGGQVLGPHTNLREPASTSFATQVHQLTPSPALQANAKPPAYPTAATSGLLSVLEADGSPMAELAIGGEQATGPVLSQAAMRTLSPAKLRYLQCVLQAYQGCNTQGSCLLLQQIFYGQPGEVPFGCRVN